MPLCWRNSASVGAAFAQLQARIAETEVALEAFTADAALDDRGRNREHRADTLTLRWILGHMVEEVARHVGHLDLLREMLDGEKGYY